MNEKQKIEISIDSGGFFSAILSIVFIAFKLSGIISWSWWWVLAPLWMPLALALVIIVLGAIAYGVLTLIAMAIKDKN
jgi:hypothetical protein